MKQEWLEKNMYLRGMTQVPNLLLDYYKELMMSEQELIAVFSLLRYQQKGSESKAAALSDYLMECLKLSRSEVQTLIFNMLSKGFLTTEHADSGKAAPDAVSLLPLYEKLTHLFSRDLLSPEQKEMPDEKINQTAELVSAFERVFNKLSPFDYEKLRDWLNNDGWSAEIILEALRQASLQRKLNFAYIDRILLNWQMNQLDTLEKIKASEDAFQRRQVLRQQAGQAANNSQSPAAAGTPKPSNRPALIKPDGSKGGKKKRYDDIVE
ncbi:MAG: DnaD domain protein [Negativicutes bacterium]|nr:DnaD domain protein [Negativicutes bacterium]